MLYSFLAFVKDISWIFCAHCLFHIEGVSSYWQNPCHNHRTKEKVHQSPLHTVPVSRKHGVKLENCSKTVHIVFSLNVPLGELTRSGKPITKNNIWRQTRG